MQVLSYVQFEIIIIIIIIISNFTTTEYRTYITLQKKINNGSNLLLRALYNGYIEPENKKQTNITCN